MKLSTEYFTLKQLKLIVFIVSIIGILSESCEFEQIDYRRPIPIASEALEVTSSSFLASWNSIEGEGSYTILVSTENAFDENAFVEGYPKTTNKTSFTVTELEADQVYYYWVKVSSKDPKVEYSNSIMVKTLPLAAPQILDPADVTPLSFMAQWQSVPKAEGYLLYVSTNANFADHLDQYNGKLISDTTAVVKDLKIDEDYFYRVKTVRGNSISPVSDLIRVSTSQLTKPLLKKASEINYTSITINWEPVQGATSYLVFVGTDQFVITDVLPEYTAREVIDATSLTVLGLNANTTYYYRIQAKNDQSESEKSDIGEESTVRLDAPTARTATNVQIDGFQANWDSVANASSYVLDISRNEGFTDLLTGYKAKEIVDTLEAVTGLSRNTSYYFRVRSKGFGAVSQNSETITVRTAFFASPKALEAVELQSTSFQAVWQPVSSADSYHLEVATDANFSNVLSDYNNLKTTDTTQLVSGLTVNKRYFYRVRALKGSVFSGYSNIVDLTTTQLSVPQLSATTAIMLTSFTINWQPVSGATQYRVDVGFDPLVENKIATDYDNRIVNDTYLNVTGLDANRTYYFKVRAENNVSTGGSATGSAKTASINPPLIADPTDVQLTSFQANWESSLNADSYLLDVAIDALFQNLVAGFNARDINDISADVTGLQPNTTYYYRVRAKGLGSTSNYSASKEVTTSPLPPPVVANVTDQEIYEFTANWQSMDEADSYLLFVATDPTFDESFVLSTYNGKEVLDTSYVVTGLDPYTDYYYRLQSKKSTTVSEYSGIIAVNACIATDCKLVERKFEGWRRENYSYNTDNLLAVIELFDITVAPATLARESIISYDANQRINDVEINNPGTPSMDQFWEFTYQDYGVGQYKVEKIVVKADDRVTDIGRYDFSYNLSGQLTNLSYIDMVTTLVSEEMYTYASSQISVNDENGDLIKRLIVGTDFNTESLLPSDVAMLLFNPTNPSKSLLPFIASAFPTYYQYRDNAISSWNNYSYSYQLNNKKIPTSVLPINGIPELTYRFSGDCIF